MGKVFVGIMALLWLTACNSGADTQTSGKQVTKADSTVQNASNDDATDEPLEDEYARYYVVITDTGQFYDPLHAKMNALQSRTKIPVDTMGRLYNRTKNLIALPDNDPDELYAGEYYPRRYPSVNLSLEYLNIYKTQSGEKTIALVAGIFESAKSADSLLAILKKSHPQAFRLKSVLYIGCMH